LRPKAKYDRLVADVNVPEARRILRALQRDLQKITARDPEQEVQGIAIPAVDAALAAIRDLIPESPVVSSIADVISPDAIDRGEPIRAVDVLLVVGILREALPQPRPAMPAVWSPDHPTPL